MLSIEPLAAFNDNYIWLLADAEQQRCAVIDPGDAGPVLAWLEAHPGWRLEQIFITHHHADHVAGCRALQATSAARIHGPAGERLPVCDQWLHDGDQLTLLDRPVQVLHVPGHTLGHIALYCPRQDNQPPLLFCGDTLFAAGCGRLFEGSPAQMLASLKRLASLDDDCLVYCTHEYTLSNLRFALAVEPSNPHLQVWQERVTAQRQAGLCSLPSRIDEEKAGNPFLRCLQPEIRQQLEQRAGRTALDEVELFATLRAWKDVF